MHTQESTKENLQEGTARFDFHFQLIKFNDSFLCSNTHGKLEPTQQIYVQEIN